MKRKSDKTSNKLELPMKENKLEDEFILLAKVEGTM